jgi:hypothetical protein
MIGRKHLKQIRQELENAFTSSDTDPIAALEAVIKSNEGLRLGADNEVAKTLKRFLERKPIAKPRRRKVRQSIKKSRGK